MEKSIPKSLVSRCNRDRKKEKAKKLTNSSLLRCPSAKCCAFVGCRAVALSSVRNVSRPVSKLPPAQLLHPAPLVETRNFKFIEQKLWQKHHGLPFLLMNLKTKGNSIGRRNPRKTVFSPYHRNKRGKTVLDFIFETCIMEILRIKKHK